jgi:hypothetical protein
MSAIAGKLKRKKSKKSNETDDAASHASAQSNSHYASLDHNEGIQFACKH